MNSRLDIIREKWGGGRLIFYYLVLGVVSALFVGLYALAPYYADDLWYMVHASDPNLSCWEVASKVWQEVLYHLQFDTARLANISSPLFLALMPKWLHALLTGAVICLTILACNRLAMARSITLRHLLLIGVVVVLPWFDYMLSVIFSLNYVWASFFAIAYLLLFFGRMRGHILLASQLGFITGWWHEGLSVPLFCALSIYLGVLFLRKVAISRYQIVAYLSLLAGIVVLACFPALWARSGAAGSNLSSHSLLMQIVSVVAFNCFFYLYLLLWIVAIVKKRLFSPQQLAYSLFFLTFGLVGTVIFLKFFGGPRVGWFNQLLSLVGSVWLLGLLLKSGRTTGLGRAVEVGVGILLIAHMGAAVAQQSSLTGEFHQIARLARQSADGTVYFDNRKPKFDLSLLKTTVRAFNDRQPLEQFEWYYIPQESKSLRLLPSALATFSIEAAAELSTGVWLYDDIIVADRSLAAECKLLRIEFDGIGPIESKFREVPFSASNGRSLFYIAPHLHGFNPEGRIISIQMVK